MTDEPDISAPSAPGPRTRLRLTDWQRNPQLISQWHRIQADPVFILALQVLQNESPVNFGLPDLGVAATDRVAHQAKTEGYHLALNNMEALGMFDEGTKPISEPTFEPEGAD